MTNRITRRTFLEKSGQSALATGALLAWARPAKGVRGANDRIGVGFVGCGGRGSYLMDFFAKVPNTRITAVCDVHHGKADQARQTKTNGQASAYYDFRRVIDDPDVDVVIVATTGQWHVLPAIHACQAGKDVYLEKPVGTSIGEGRAAINAARKHNGIIQMGTQQRSWDHYKQAVEIIHSGALGEISNVHVWDLENYFEGFGAPPDEDPPPELDWDFYCGPASLVPYNVNRYRYHYWFFDYGGAWQLDWAVHHYDIVNWAMKVTAPITAVGVGAKYAFVDPCNTDWPDTFNGVCEYAPGPVATKGFTLSYTFHGGSTRLIEGRRHGKAFYGTHGTLVLDRTGYDIYSEQRDGKKLIEDRHVATIGENNAVANHIEVFFKAVRREAPPVADIEDGHRASNPGHLMNISWRTGRRIHWNAEKEQVIDDPEANNFVTKHYRKPWTLEPYI